MLTANRMFAMMCYPPSWLVWSGMWMPSNLLRPQRAGGCGRWNAVRACVRTAAKNEERAGESLGGRNVVGSGYAEAWVLVMALWVALGARRIGISTATNDCQNASCCTGELGRE